MSDVYHQPGGSTSPVKDGDLMLFRPGQTGGWILGVCNGSGGGRTRILVWDTEVEIPSGRSYRVGSELLEPTAGCLVGRRFRTSAAGARALAAHFKPGLKLVKVPR